jgi:hypothetical protein
LLKTVWLGLLLGAGLSVAGCGKKLSLPEPESRPAQVYTQYCSRQECHGALPPQRDAWGIWKLQYDRMIVLMRDQGLALPNPEEETMILDYLQKFARKPD